MCVCVHRFLFQDMFVCWVTVVVCVLVFLCAFVYICILIRASVCAYTPCVATVAIEKRSALLMLCLSQLCSLLRHAEDASVQVFLISPLHAAFATATYRLLLLPTLHYYHSENTFYGKRTHSMVREHLHCYPLSTTTILILLLSLALYN